jgi:hypothetical protein
MNFIEINTSDRESVEASFSRIAKRLFSDYQLVVNEIFYYRLIDIEFYYYAPGKFEDVYANRHEAQRSSGKWYSHGSGIDITFGNGEYYGGILIRGIASIRGEGQADHMGIYKQIHGPLNVKTEIFSNMHGAFEKAANYLYLQDVSQERMGANMANPEYIVRTNRIGLNPAKDSADKGFYNGKYRYVIFPHLKLKNKTQIAHDMRNQLEMSIKEINKELGSRFLKEEVFQTV